MAVNKRLLQGAAAAPGAITPSEHFGVVLYEGDGSSSHSINGGKFGAAFYGNGSNSKITFDTNFSQQTSFTISFWFNSSQYNDDHTIFQFEGDSNENSNRIGLFASGTEFGFYPHNTSGGAGRTSISTSDSSALYNGNWHHVALVIDGTSNSDATMYIDGSSKTLTTYESYTTTMRMTGDMRIGGRKDDSAGEFMEGKLDQLRVFQKALSSSEVSTLYAETVDTVESLDPLSEDTTDTLQVLGDSSCIATYRFENNEDDESGNYDGTGTAIQYTAGRYGQAASFNGSNIGSGGAFVELQNSASIGNDVSAITMSVWVKFDNLNTQNFIIYRQDASDVANQGIYDYGNGTLYFQPINTNYGSDRGTISNSGLYTTGEWVHIVMVYDGSGTGNSGRLKAYINGSQVTLTYNGTQPTTTGSSSSRPLRIGGRRDGNATFSGDIDQVRIFNKALSASEVTTLYNENSLVASYRFEGNSNDDKRTYDGTDSNVTYEFGLNFTPDFVWLKNRSQNNYAPRIFDSSRGATKRLQSSSTSTESTDSTSLTSFDTGGFTLGSDNYVNNSGDDFVAWCLKANGGTTESNTDGDITSTVQVNSDAGFSIVKWASSNYSQTIGHGLDSAPDLIIAKELDTARNWLVYSSALGNDNYLQLNVTNASSTPNAGRLEVSGTDKFICGTDGTNQIAYCFKNVDGFSKFGSYTGNGDANGPIVETGFEPAFIMFKRTDSTGDWRVLDNKRSLTNPRNEVLKPNSSEVEESDSPSLKVDFLSNGFQLKSTHSAGNTNGATYLYMAFAADPDTEAPTLASSFNAIAYSGNSSTNTITGYGFEPSLSVIKKRSGADDWAWFDTIRGSNFLSSNTTSAEGAFTTWTPNSDGFEVLSSGMVNATGSTYISYGWKADDNEPTIFGGAAKAVYKFEDNGNDVTGNNNATATSITYGTGKFNKGAIFNGTTSNFKTGSSFTGTNGGSFTLSCWVKIDDITGVENLLLGRFSYTTSDKQFILRVLNGGAVRINVYNSSGTGESITTTDTLSIDTWYHIVAVVDGTKKSLYIDGELSVSETGSVSSNSSATGFLEIGGAGHLPASDAGRLDGMMDQVRIYNGAVSDVGVAALYAETASDNDDLTLGGPPETIISANANAGFSIVKYEGTGVTGTRVPHGLSSAPELWIGKQLTGSAINWQVLYSGFSEGDYLTLNTNAAKGNSANVTFDPTATTVKFHANQALNDSGEEYIGYAFHSVSGYSKFGTYTGTGSSQTITTGFQPDWIVTKRTDTTDNWRMYDSVRQNTQPFDEILYPNLSNAEEDNTTFVTGTTSTGFTLGSGNGSNASGGTYIYMAFKIN